MQVRVIQSLLFLWRQLGFEVYEIYFFHTIYSSIQCAFFGREVNIVLDIKYFFWNYLGMSQKIFILWKQLFIKYLSIVHLPIYTTLNRTWSFIWNTVTVYYYILQAHSLTFSQTCIRNWMCSINNAREKSFGCLQFL